MVRVAKHVLWKAEERWNASGESDNEYVLRSMMWADNYRLFCHNREFLHMVNDIIGRTDEPGHGTQARITMVDELRRGGGQAHAQGVRKRERL